MPNRKAVILVVEDNALIRMLVASMALDAGFEVLEAADANDAIHILETRPDIHLVFTDIEMPGAMDGIKLARFIRNRWPPVKLIVTSGRTVVDERHLPQGALFFPKPYNDNAIVEAMVGMLAKSASRT